MKRLRTLLPILLALCAATLAGCASSRPAVQEEWDGLMLRPGTRLGGMHALRPLEALRYISIFRLIHPESILLCAGGREAVLGDYQPWALFAGANALIAGDYLTTKGSPAEEDADMMRDLELPVLRYT